MASFETPNFKAPKHAFDSDDLAILDEAFDATWTAIKSHHPLYAPKIEEDLRSDVRRLLLHLAARGISDVPTLRELVLVAVPVSVVAPAPSASGLTSHLGELTDGRPKR